MNLESLVSKRKFDIGLKYLEVSGVIDYLVLDSSVSQDRYFELIRRVNRRNGFIVLRFDIDNYMDSEVCYYILKLRSSTNDFGMYSFIEGGVLNFVIDFSLKVIVPLYTLNGRPIMELKYSEVYDNFSDIFLVEEVSNG